MAWKEVLVMEERCRFVLLAEKHQQSFTSLCEEYGISRNTGYKWVSRYQKYGLISLRELSRRPMTSWERVTGMRSIELTSAQPHRLSTTLGLLQTGPVP